jgi:peptidoglycan/xylan/chitin deacetylase (PgdA/CDA1 family)
MRIPYSLGEVRRRLLSSVHRRPARLREPGPFVTFCFDDFPRSAYTVGAAILRNFGVRGTYYVAMGLMDTNGPLGESFRLDDLRSLVEDGHELASHTYSHVSCRKVPLRDFRADVRKGQLAIRELAELTPTGNFAYPYGEVTLAAKKAVGSQMRSCRGTAGGINCTGVDLNLLRANPLYGTFDRLQAVESLIVENKREKGWLIFYTHDVGPKPSRFGCTAQLLEGAVRSAVESGAEIRPIAGVLELMVRCPSESTESASYEQISA